MTSYLWPSFIHPKDKNLLSRLYGTWLTYPSLDPRRIHQSVAGKRIQKGMAQGSQWSSQTPEIWTALQKIWEQDSSKVWVWSDLHLFHDSIIQLTQRPFQSLIDMNEHLLKEAMKLDSSDWLIFVGDVSFGLFEETQLWLSMIQAHKILILGNHDIHNAIVRQNPFEIGFEGVCDSLELIQNEQKLWLTHYPIVQNWILENTLNVHGHLHKHLLEGPYVNVCVEQTDYRPVLLRQVIQKSL